MTPYSLFSGRSVLVTGDTGFKGSWLAHWLLELGAEVWGLSLPPESERDHYVLSGLKDQVRHFDQDIRDLDGVKEVFARARPEVLFHLAAQPLVRLSYDEPKLTFDTNVGGSLNVLEAARACVSLRAVVYVTTDKCYRNREWLFGYRENDELGGHDPYSASKAAAEILIASYQSSFFSSMPHLGVASVRAGNVIGGGDWAKDRIVPDCIRALQRGEPVGLRNPRSTRPWQHVLDPLSGYLKTAVLLLQDPKRFSTAYNFGPTLESIQDVEALAAAIVEEWGSGSLEEAREVSPPHEATLLHLNCDKAYQELGWLPTWDFKTTVARTVEWYKGLQEGREAAELTRGQIRDFMREAI
ncbi:MAG: CDP-glucose 4,6-dehydratase [Longimicrobiales bacterium]